MALPPPDLQAQYAAQQKRQKTWLAVGGASAIVAAFFVGLVASGALQFGAKSPEQKTLQARGTAPDNALLLKEGKPPEPALQKTADAPAEMPADVLVYLQHLEKCEKQKVQIASEQETEMQILLTKLNGLGAAAGIVNPEDIGSDEQDIKSPDAYARENTINFRPPWDEAYSFFRSLKPPAECEEIAGNYDRALSEISAQMADVGELLNNVQTDPAKALNMAKKMQNKSKEGIDNYYGDADGNLSAICVKYRKPKWFEIKRDVGNSGILGKISGL
ncbi:hypothetical protein EON79_02470 [bacterium]|nr:MAG: hypothetical protein EON79_02470 [bacterium]